MYHIVVSIMFVYSYMCWKPSSRLWIRRVTVT